MAKLENNGFNQEFGSLVIFGGVNSIFWKVNRAILQFGYFLVSANAKVIFCIPTQISSSRHSKCSRKLASLAIRPIIKYNWLHSFLKII